MTPWLDKDADDTPTQSPSQVHIHVPETLPDGTLGLGPAGV